MTEHRHVLGLSTLNGSRDSLGASLTSLSDVHSGGRRLAKGSDWRRNHVDAGGR